MEGKPRLGPREKQIVELLLQGCENSDIAAELKMNIRTVKCHFNRLFMRFGITDGIKRVKLATLLYRRQLCHSETLGTLAASPISKSELSSLSHKAIKTVKWPSSLEPQSMSLKTTCESSTTSSDCGTESSLLSGLKPTKPNLIEGTL
jgi:hypothetical protein